MKWIRLIVLNFLVFFVLACVVAFFIPSQIRVFRMLRLAPGSGKVLSNVNDLSRWKHWYPGFDSISLKNPEVKNNRVIKAKAGNIILSVKQSTDSFVAVAMQKGQRTVTTTWQLNKDLESDSLVLQNYTDLHLNWYPWEKFSGLLMDKTYGDRMMQGLKNLRDQNTTNH